MAAFADRRADLMQEREALRRARGAAMLDGKDFDACRLTAIGDALVALDDAEIEEARRAAAEAATALEQSRAGVRAEITEHDSARLQALAKAETAAREMVTQLAEFVRLGSAIADSCDDLGTAPPVVLSRSDIDTRLSRRLAAALGPIQSSAYSFGVIEWNSIPFTAEGWVDAERATTRTCIAELLKETT